MNRAEWFERSPSGDVAPLAARRKLHELLTSRFVSRIGNLKYSREAIVMAGPPGAGKSTALHAVLARDVRSSEHFAVIDSDAFKADLLLSAMEDGWYERLVPQVVAKSIASGEAFFPMDFAPLVHIESTILARTVTRQLLRAGANVVIDGTLSGATAARETFDMLAVAGYESQLIVDVEATRSTAERRAYLRWLEEYESALAAVAANTPVGRFGGRLVPPSAYDWLYPDESPLTRSLSTALTIEREYREHVRLVIYRSTDGSALPELEWDSTAGGPVLKHDSGGRTYVNCVVCHHPLYDPESIRLGMGKVCSKRTTAAASF